MGRYINEILQPGERVLYSTNEHWMFFLPAIAAWIVAVAFLVLWRLVTGDALMLLCLALAAVAGLAAFSRLLQLEPEYELSLCGRINEV